MGSSINKENPGQHRATVSPRKPSLRAEISGTYRVQPPAARMATDSLIQRSRDKRPHAVLNTYGGQEECRKLKTSIPKGNFC